MLPSRLAQLIAATQGGAAAPFTPPPVNTVLPAITGTPTDGQTLTGSTGTWTGSPTGYEFNWRRDGVAQGGFAGSDTYLLGPDDVGAVITLVVRATNAGGGASATSAGVGPVAAGGSAGDAFFDRGPNRFWG